MTEQHQDNTWKRMSFKGNKVWVQTDDNGNLLLENNKVLIKYNLNQEYEYRVKPESLHPEEEAIPARTRSSKKPSPRAASHTPSQTPDHSSTPADDSIRIYTDGASSGNPGPSGIGILLLYGENRKEISKNIGMATNNIAELTAIKKGLEELKRFDLPVRIFSDSSYAIGLLSQNWKPKKNQDLVHEIKELMSRFSDLKLIKVKGHSGVKENEVADFLATSAIKKDLR